MCLNFNVETTHLNTHLAKIPRALSRCCVFIIHHSENSLVRRVRTLAGETRH